MNKLILILAITLLAGCNAENSRECIQANNRVITYTDSLARLNELYKGELDTEEAKRRIDAMQRRVEIAKYSVEADCH